MTVQQICTFFLNHTYFGIAIEDVQEIIQQPPLTRIPLAPVDVCGLINLRGQIIPVIDLPCRLGLRSTVHQMNQTYESADHGTNNGANHGTDDDIDHGTYNIIVMANHDIVSLIVDDIGDVLDCHSTLFEPPPATLNPQIRSFLKGAYKLESGFLLVLDTTRILEPAIALHSLN